MTKPFFLIAAPHTPLLADGHLNLEMIPKQCEFLLANQVDGVFICGTTGEGLSLTVAERRQVAEAWKACGAGRLRIIAHVGHTSTMEAAGLASHARELGLAGVAAVAPCFMKPTSIAELVAFMAPVAAACAPLPFLYYDLPSVTGVSLNAARFLEEASKQMPNLAGVKFTNTDLVAYQECLRAEGGRFEAYFGVDEMLLGALAMGCRMAVGSTYNYTSVLHRKIVAAFDGGDIATARLLQKQSVELVRLIEKYGGPIRAGKAVMHHYGIDCGPTRAPLTPLSPSEIYSLGQELRALPQAMPLVSEH
jgi:N-acetylneuraminate lyase